MLDAVYQAPLGDDTAVPFCVCLDVPAPHYPQCCHALLEATTAPYQQRRASEATDSPKNLFFVFVPCCAAQLQRRHVSTLKTRGAGKTTLKIARIARKNAFTSTDVQLASGGGRRGNKKLRLQLLQTLLRHQYSKNCRMAIPSSKVRRCLLSESAAEVERG